MKKLNGFCVDNTPRGIAAEAFKEYVENGSNGQIKIEFNSNETYGTEHEMIQAVQTGTLDMQIVGANMMANTIPQFSALSLPFLTQSMDEGHAVLDGSVGAHLKELGEEHGFKVLSDIALGYAQITNNVRPINNPKDLIGIKMRTPNDVSFIETFKAFGATVSIMPYEEIYTGLTQGLIDGQFNPLANSFDLNICDVQDYLAMTNHAFYVAYMIMNKDTFDSLDYELQQLILEAGKKGKDAARKYVSNNETRLKERAKTVFKDVSYPEMKPFQEAIQPMYKKMEEVMGAEIINRIEGFLKEYRGKK